MNLFICCCRNHITFVLRFSIRSCHVHIYSSIKLSIATSNHQLPASLTRSRPNVTRCQHSFHNNLPCITLYARVSVILFAQNVSILPCFLIWWYFCIQFELFISVRLLLYPQGMFKFKAVNWSLNNSADWTHKESSMYVYGSDHETAAVLCAVNRWQNQVTRQAQFRDLTHIRMNC